MRGLLFVSLFLINVFAEPNEVDLKHLKCLGKSEFQFMRE